MNQSTFRYSLIATACMVVPVLAAATDGYFQPGYSVISNGMGGVSLALPQDAMVGATNPAGMALIGNRMDAGLSLFRPNRSATLASAQGSATFDGNDKSSFLIPEFGYNRPISPQASLGVSVYGNGGMNTGYSQLNAATMGAQCANPNVLRQFGNSAAACAASPVGKLGMYGAGDLGVNLQQLFVAPTWGYKINEQNAVGVSVNLVYQTFSATGLEAFQGISANPAHLTSTGQSTSHGVGVHLGWLGQFTPELSVGVSLQPRTHMSQFSGYSGLFAGGGSFDIPANFGVGLAWKPSSRLTVAADVQRIRYSGVPAVGNASDCALMGTCQLGASNGGGFGWSDMTVLKLGTAYRLNPDLVLRAGWNYATQAVPSSQTMINVLAPGVTQNHLSLGLTYSLNKSMELSAYYLHAFNTTVTGTGMSQGVNISMHQDTMGAGLSWKF